MTTRKKTSSAIKEYCVYATQVVYRNVEAASAAEAYCIARDDPYSFEPCGPDLTLDRAVKVVETDEFVHVGGAACRCRSCGSEIVPTVNDSHFNEGECGGCEYHRYRACQELYEAAVDAVACFGDLVREDKAADADVEAYEGLQRAVAKAEEHLPDSGVVKVLPAPKHGQAA